jgi:hypothetical protein
MFMENNLITNPEKEKEKEKNQEKEQEINLLEIVQKIGRWCFKIVRIVFIYLLQRSIPLAIFIFAAVVFSGLLYSLSKPFYSTSMLVRANVENDFFYVTLINANFSRRHVPKSEDLAQRLGVSEAIAKQIKSIQAYYAVDLNNDGLPDAPDERGKFIFSEDSIKASRILHTIFYVNARVYSTEVYQHIRQSIMNLVGKNEYIRQQNERRLAVVREQIVYLHQQQYRFDSLQQYEYFQKEKGKKSADRGQLLILNEQNQPLYHNDLIGLNNQILGNHTTLELYADPLTVVQDFSLTTRRTNGLMYYVKPLVLIFFFLGLISLLVWDYRKYFLKLYREKIPI